MGELVSDKFGQVLAGISILMDAGAQEKPCDGKPLIFNLFGDGDCGEQQTVDACDGDDCNDQPEEACDDNCLDSVLVVVGAPPSVLTSPPCATC